MGTTTGLQGSETEEGKEWVREGGREEGREGGE
jgi:hypothetical protein